jgi:hypothetical protein
MRKACHDADCSKRDAQKIHVPKINILETDPWVHWSTFGHLRHAFGQALSKKRHFFPSRLGKNNPDHPL